MVMMSRGILVDICYGCLRIFDSKKNHPVLSPLAPWEYCAVARVTLKLGCRTRIPFVNVIVHFLCYHYIFHIFFLTIFYRERRALFKHKCPAERVYPPLLFSKTMYMIEIRAPKTLGISAVFMKWARAPLNKDIPSLSTLHEY